LFARNDLLVTNALDNTFTTTVKIPQPLAGTAKTALNKTPGNNKV
jgi:hypothetical protein